MNIKSKSFTPFQRLRSIIRIFQKRKIIIPMFKDFYAGRYQMPWARMLLFVFTLAYLIWPLDIVPDFIIGLGWIDDIIIFAFAADRMEEELIKYQQFKNANQGKPVLLTKKWR
ncbi:MAG TPA: DUF1232 domain-containing protein [Edaphocola sp.]|nr:DUF1232 domain-containing protein [Edaphocola sp.]